MVFLFTINLGTIEIYALTHTSHIDIYDLTQYYKSKVQIVFYVPWVSHSLALSTDLNYIDSASVFGAPMIERQKWQLIILSLDWQKARKIAVFMLSSPQYFINNSKTTKESDLKLFLS